MDTDIKIAFVGVGKLGKDAAEVLDDYYDVTGYDVRPITTTSIKMEYDLETAVKGKDVVFIAVPTAHHPDYDGRYATSHLPPKDFDYSVAIEVTEEVDRYVDSNTLIVMISTMLPRCQTQRSISTRTCASGLTSTVMSLASTRLRTMSTLCGPSPLTSLSGLTTAEGSLGGKSRPRPMISTLSCLISSRRWNGRRLRRS